MSEQTTAAPLVQCYPVLAGKPSLGDNTADIDRLKKALRVELDRTGADRKHLVVPFVRTGEVAAKFRGAGFRGYAMVNNLAATMEIVDFFPESPAAIPAVALDLGTTHLEARLIDLLTGRQLAHGHRENRQIEYGTDILSRIHYAAPSRKEKTVPTASEGLRQLQESVVASINDLVGRLAAAGGITANEIRAMSVAGNTTMVHFLLGLNPYHICREPYIPVVNEPDPCLAGEIGIKIFPFAPVWVLPSIGSYFGGDLVSGIMASGIDESDETSMLIDVGTNAEVVLGNRDWLIACAGAAGPALEGGVARMGMKAATGAIESVAIDTREWTLTYRTIDDAPPRGICGSGLIDLVAQLYLARIIDFRGKFRSNIRSQSPEQEFLLQKRLCRDGSGQFFIVAFPEETQGGERVILSQTDLDAMMRSKAAMYAILRTLVAQVGVEFTDLHKIYVAGAFGKHINPKHAVTLGMIPDLPQSTYESVGNSSLKGAELILLSEENRQRSSRIRRIVTYLELNVNQEFMIRFSGARFIPHTEPSLFPSVPLFQEDDGSMSG